MMRATVDEIMVSVVTSSAINESTDESPVNSGYSPVLQPVFLFIVFRGLTVISRPGPYRRLVQPLLVLTRFSYFISTIPLFHSESTIVLSMRTWVSPTQLQCRFCLLFYAQTCRLQRWKRIAECLVDYPRCCFLKTAWVCRTASS